MQYLTQGKILAQVKTRLNNRTAVTFPWTDDEARLAIAQAVGMVFPVGNQTVITMAKADYDANPQKFSVDNATSAVPTEPGILHIRQAEVRNSAGQPVLLERGVHYQWSQHGAQFLYLYQPMAVGETLRLDVVLGVAEPSGVDATARTAEDSATIKLDSTLVVLYAAHILLQMNARTSGVSSRQDDQILSENFRIQAEGRKAFVFQQQYGTTMELPERDKR